MTRDEKIERLKVAETVLIKASKDPFVNSVPILSMQVIPALLDVVLIVREMVEGDA